MDFFSVATCAGSLACITFKAIESVGQYIAETGAVSDTINDFHRSIWNFHRALQCVARTFERVSREETDADQRHHPEIFQTLRECRFALDRLRRQLPELSEGPGALARAKASFEIRLKRPVIQSLLSSIDSNSQTLQMTIMSLSYGAALDTQQQILHLRRDIRQASFSSLPQYTEVDGDALGLQLAHQGARREQDGAPWVALKEATMSMSELSVNTRTLGRSRSSTTLDSDDGGADDGDDFDPEERENLPRRSFLESALDENLELAGQMFLEGLFDLAASYQKKAIAHREQLAKLKQEPFPFDEECFMKEQLVDLLLSSESKGGAYEAEATLQTLLTREVQRQPGDEERYLRLNHKLGSLCLNLNKLRQAQRFLERAVQGRPGADPPPIERVQDSLSLLIETLYLKKDYGEARAYARLMPKQKLLPEETTPRATPAGTHAWCKERGFNVGSDNFFFHTLQVVDGKTTSPIHSAIEAGEADILRQMLECRPNLDVGDEQEAQRPLQVAALKRNREMVELLLDHRAQGDVRDKYGRTILHCCQHKSEGVDVTELVTRRIPEIVNVKAKNGRTALFQALEMGNEESVRIQLSRGANPNIGLDLGGYIMSTPLIWVIENKAQTQWKINMVKILLEGGADTEGRSSDGRTPRMAADKAGLAREPIRKLLESTPYKYGSSSSKTSSSSKVSSSSKGSSSGKSTSTTPAPSRQPDPRAAPAPRPASTTKKWTFHVKLSK